MICEKCYQEMDDKSRYVRLPSEEERLDGLIESLVERGAKRPDGAPIDRTNCMETIKELSELRRSERRRAESDA